ncbi:uncharacterized protein ACRADG_012757 [Cochliomyia hominivorax]
MYVNTGGRGKTQQQPLQNQTNSSVRHKNLYPHSHTQHTSQQQQQQQQAQPQYEHHQGPVTFVAYPFCNVTSASHGATGGNAVGVCGGQVGHVLYQTSHQSQTQPHSPQQQVGLQNPEQTLHYFTKSTPMPTHHNSQIRNMIATVSHQRQPYMVTPNYFTLSHSIQAIQQTRTPNLPNTAHQHSIAAASSGTIATQLQNSASKSVVPSGPTAYVPPPYCTPPLLLGAVPKTVIPQPATAVAGMGQPITLQAYAHMDGGMATVSASATKINMSAVGLGVGAGVSTNNEHTSTKQRKHAIPIINPDTLEIVTFENLAESPTKTQQTETTQEKEVNVESVIMQKDSDKSAPLDDAPLDGVMILQRSLSITATETDKKDDQIQKRVDEDDDVLNEKDGDDDAKQTSNLAIEPTTFSYPVAHTPIQDCRDSPKPHVFADPNDTEPDTNKLELDNEDDVLSPTDGICSLACIEQEFIPNLLLEDEPMETTQTAESDSEHSSETEIKSKDELYTISARNSLKRKDEEVEMKCKETQQDYQSVVSSAIATDSKRGRKNKKVAKRKEKNQKKLKQQQNKSNNTSTQNYDNCNSSSSLLKNTVLEGLDSKDECDEEVESRINLIRYSLAELKSFAKSPESLKTPVVVCHMGDCISQLFVARQQHYHHHYLSHQVNQNINAINLQHHVQQSYHHMNFNESIEFVTGKRRVGGGGSTRKHHDNHNNAASTGNINTSGVTVAPSSGAGAVRAFVNQQNQKKLQVIHINLSLKEEITLSKCEHAWQPKFLTDNSNNSLTTDRSKNDDDDDESIDDVLKKVRGILNKLTSENFEALLKEMTNVRVNTQEKMQKVMLLIFEKTVSEPNFAPTYAKFSKVLFEEVEAESKKIFNTLLITRLQTEFELNVNNADAKERTLQQIISKLNGTTDQEERIELQAELDHQEYQFRRRAWGTVRFIGEMYKLHSLSSDRVLQCVESLLKHGNDEKLEYMCKLLTTVGGLLEGSDRESFSNNLRMNKIFTKIQTIVKEARDSSNKKTKLCSRVRFMMQDLIDLRSRHWGQTSNAPSSHVAQRRRHIEEKNNCFSTSSMQRMSYGGNNNRHNQIRPKGTSSSGTGCNYFAQKPPKSQHKGQREQQSIDLKKLNFSRGDESLQATTKLGNSSIYMWRTTAGRQTYTSNDPQQIGRISPTNLQVSSTQQYLEMQQLQQQKQSQQNLYWSGKNQNSPTDIKAILATCTNKDNQKLLNHLIEEYLDCLPSRSSRWQEEILNTWQKTNNKQQICLVYYILMDYLHLANVKHLEQNACANIFIYLMNNNAFNKTLFSQAYEQFAEEFPDLLMDVPNGWSYVFQFLGPILHERLLSFTDIWHTNWRSDRSFTERFVIALVDYFTKEFGANYMRDLWHNKFKLDRGQVFMSDQQQWRQFVTRNKLQFLYDSKLKPEII